MVRARSTGRLSDRHAVKAKLRRAGLHTVCEEARCPNMGECFGARTATFLILGDRCTRSCRFCAVGHAPAPQPPDPGEAQRVAETVESLALRHAVVTSVTRDDLPDGGASAFAACIAAIRARTPEVTVEVLIPDLAGDRSALATVLDAGPDVLNHNLETVARLYPRVRPAAIYERSLALLGLAAADGRAVVKSGLMVGLGERIGEVDDTLAALRAVGCQVVTIGQYLQPTRESLPVEAEIDEATYAHWRDLGHGLGLRVIAGPLVRSSYTAAAVFDDFRRGE